MKDLDKYKGCLIGGAVGDALGYPVEDIARPRESRYEENRVHWNGW